MNIRKMIVIGKDVSMFTKEHIEYISLTDMAKSKDANRSDYIIQNWIRNRNSIEFIGLWEILHNSKFNSIEFDGFRNNAGLNSFSLTPQRWIEKTNAIGIISKSGRYGGTFAHQDIAFEFAARISNEQALPQNVRLKKLKEIAINKMKSLIESNIEKKIEIINKNYPNMYRVNKL